MIGSEVDRMRHLLVEAVGTLCRSGLHYKSNLKVEGLIGITLDEADIILVNLNKNYALPGVQEERLKSPSHTPDPSVTPVPESEDDYTAGSTPRSKRRSVQSDGEESSRKRHRPPVTQGRTASQASCTRNTNTDHHTSNCTPPTAETRLSDPTVISPNIPSESLAAAAESWLQCSGSGSTATDSKAVVKIEIDSDPEDVIKIEEKPFTDCAAQRLQPDPSVSTNELTGVISTDYPHSNPGMSSGLMTSEHFTNASTVPAIPMQLYTSVNQEVSGQAGLGMLSTAATYDQTQVPTASGSGTTQNIPYMTSTSSAGSMTAIKPSLQTSVDAPVSSLKMSATKQNPDNLTCRYCGKVFRSMTGKQDHERSHEGRFRYRCVLCQRGFNNQNNLVYHMHSHENLKPFRCIKCKRGYNNKYYRNRHQITCSKVSTSGGVTDTGPVTNESSSLTK